MTHLKIPFIGLLFLSMGFPHGRPSHANAARPASITELFSAAQTADSAVTGQSLSSTPGIRPFDIVINELMVRPAPAWGLPEAEYIELYNRSCYPVNLEGWTIHAGNRFKTLPRHTIQPGGFLLLTHEKNSCSLEPYGDVAALAAFPVLAMGGQTVVLKDQGGRVISAVRYSDSWYGSSIKAGGGWSLEQVDPFNPCGGAANWRASESSSGGTPGAPNSVLSSNPDTTPPALLRATYHHTGSIRLHFSEPMHPESGRHTGKYHAEGAGKPIWVVPAEPFFTETDLFFNYEFKEGRDYKIEITGLLYDCAGNYADNENLTARFTMPVNPRANDIVINELLFDPWPGGAEFVELYNRSGKTFDLRQVLLTGMENDRPGQAFVAAPGGYLLFPGDYAVLTTMPDKVKMQYHSPSPVSFIQMERMPHMNNQGGHIAITDIHYNIIDNVQYTASMHSPMVANRKGISLERIHYNRSSSDPTNWLSAGESHGFATPGYRNSQFYDNPGNHGKVLTADPQVFSPDNSGHNDVVHIHYELPKPGYTGSITIFDSRGRTVRRLVRNELFGTSGSYSWDGRNDTNTGSRLGIYLILMELYHPDGDTAAHKTTVVLAGRLRQ